MHPYLFLSESLIITYSLYCWCNMLNCGKKAKCLERHQVEQPGENKHEQATITVDPMFYVYCKHWKNHPIIALHWQNILFVISEGKLTLGLVWWIDLNINPPIYKSVQKTSIMTDLIFSRPYQYFEFSLNFSKFSAATQPQDYLICKLLMGCSVLQPTSPLEGLILKR